ncbi:MAG: OmpA family protein, partial [Gammaproteobacteria bacterium]|nr:OmpA family protein [Gammaproteobacteria bacterium]
PIASNTLGCSEELGEPETYIYRPQFDVLSTELKEVDRESLRELAARLANRPVITVKVRGHTDSDMIPPRNHHLFKNNIELGYARAKSVANFLAATLGINPDRIDVEGVGPFEQLATNLTAEGKAQNRRVEVQVYAGALSNGHLINVLEADSGFKTVVVEGQGWAAPVLWQPPMVTQLGLQDLNSKWINQQNNELALVLPSEGYTPEGISIPIAVKHDPKQRVQVEINGAGVSALNYQGQERSRNRKVAVSTWKGVDIPAGDSELVVFLFDKEGTIVETITRTVRRSTAPAYAELLSESSRLIIDGQQPATLAIRLTDVSGAPIGRGTAGEFNITSGQQSLETAVDAGVQGTVNGRPARYRYVVADDNGTAFIRLSPATPPGRIDIDFRFSDNRQNQVSAWLTEAPRDWILVGLAEGSLSQQAPAGSVQSADGDEVYSDGRVAFFAKGRILGSALLTLRYDDNEEEAQQFGHGGTIDPNAWYTLYGDQSFGGQEGVSQEQIYVRLERGAFHATYGDITTDLNVVELANYQRSLTGLKSELRGRYVSYNLFAAETETGYARDEIPGDGTSGLYRLSQVPELNTESIRLETRDRLRSHEIVETRTLRRYYDYQINYNDGTVFFREPVAVRDADFNPVYIVAEYEVQDGGEKVTTAGARLALHNASQRLMLGVSYITEDDSLAKRSLVAADGRVRFGQHGELKFEYGETERDIAGVNTVAAGKVIELSHRGDRINGRVYFREIEAGYGLGSVSASENATRKVGAEAEIKLGKHVSITADVADEENLTAGNKRRYGQLGLRLH